MPVPRSSPARVSRNQRSTDGPAAEGDQRNKTLCAIGDINDVGALTESEPIEKFERHYGVDNCRLSVPACREPSRLMSAPPRTWAASPRIMLCFRVVCVTAASPLRMRATPPRPHVAGIRANSPPYEGPFPRCTLDATTGKQRVATKGHTRLVSEVPTCEPAHRIRKGCRGSVRDATRPPYAYQAPHVSDCLNATHVRRALKVRRDLAAGPSRARGLNCHAIPGQVKGGGVEGDSSSGALGAIAAADGGGLLLPVRSGCCRGWLGTVSGTRGRGSGGARPTRRVALPGRPDEAGCPRRGWAHNQGCFRTRGPANHLIAWPSLLVCGLVDSSMSGDPRSRFAAELACLRPGVRMTGPATGGKRDILRGMAPRSGCARTCQDRRVQSAMPGWGRVRGRRALRLAAQRGGGGPTSSMR